MSEQRIDTQETPHVVVSGCVGDLIISRWTRAGVGVTGEQFTAVSPELDLVTIASEKPLQIQTPTHARLTIQTVQGNLTIKHVAGLVKVGQVQENLTLKSVGSIQIEDVQQEVQGESVDGPLRITAVHGPITLRNCSDVQIETADQGVSVRYVNGRVTLGSVEGDLDLHTISSDLTVTAVSGHVRASNLGGQNRLTDVQGRVVLGGGLVSGEHSVQAQGGIYLYWPTSAPLHLQATGGEIVNKLPLKQPIQSVENGLTTLSGYIQNRKTFLVLKTVGQIGLTTWDQSGEPVFVAADFVATPSSPVVADTPAVSHLETAVSQAVNQVLARIEMEFGLEWKHRLAAMELADRLTAALMRQLAQLPSTSAALTPATPGVQAFARAETAVRHSLQKVSDSLDKARQKLQDSPTPETAADVAPRTASPPPPLLPPATPVSVPTLPNHSPAQLRILDLLEKGVISVEDAGKLLQALA